MKQLGTMFLEGKQKTRFDGYESLKGQEKNTFTFRIVEKVRTFLDDVAEVNRVLERLPIKSRKKAFKDAHVYELFDLIEKAIISLDMLPIMTDPQTGTAFVYGEFEATPGKGNTSGVYKFTRPATDEEFARWEGISAQIKRLQELITEPRKYPEKLTFNEFRDMVDAMSK